MSNQEITSQLIDELEELSTDGMMPLERRMVDTAVWYHRNKDRIPREAVTKRLDFIEKAFDIHLEMMAMYIKRLHRAEGRRQSDSLWLPAGITMTDDFGKTTGFK